MLLSTAEESLGPYEGEAWRTVCDLDLGHLHGEQWTTTRGSELWGPLLLGEETVDGPSLSRAFSWLPVLDHSSKLGWVYSVEDHGQGQSICAGRAGASRRWCVQSGEEVRGQSG